MLGVDVAGGSKGQAAMLASSSQGVGSREGFPIQLFLPVVCLFSATGSAVGREGGRQAEVNGMPL